MQGVGEMCVEGEGAGGKTWTDWLSCFTTVRTVFLKFDLWLQFVTCLKFREFQSNSANKETAPYATWIGGSVRICRSKGPFRSFSIVSFIDWVGFGANLPRAFCCFPHWACQSDLPIGEHQWCSCSCCSLWDYSWEAVKLPCFLELF